MRGCWLTQNVLGAAGEGPGEAVWGYFVCVPLVKLQQGVGGFLSSLSGDLAAWKLSKMYFREGKCPEESKCESPAAAAVRCDFCCC